MIVQRSSSIMILPQASTSLTMAGEVNGSEWIDRSFRGPRDREYFDQYKRDLAQIGA